MYLPWSQGDLGTGSAEASVQAGGSCIMISKWNIINFTLDHPAGDLPVSCLGPSFLIALDQILVWGISQLTSLEMDPVSQDSHCPGCVLHQSDMIFGTDLFPCAGPQEFFPSQLANCSGLSSESVV